MPKATQGGVSDQSVDSDYIAPAGIPPQDAIDAGIPDQGAEQERTEQQKLEQGPQQDSRAQDEQRAKREQDERQDDKQDDGAPVGISGQADAEVVKGDNSQAKKATPAKRSSATGK